MRSVHQRTDVKRAGLDGFYAFDLVSAVFARHPARFECARVTAWVGDDALLVAQAAVASKLPEDTLYWNVASARIDELFR